MVRYNVKKIFSARLSEEARAKGLSQAYFSRELNVSKNTVSLWFKGENFPRESHIESICDILNVSPAWLMGGYDAEMSLFQAMSLIGDHLGFEVRATPGGGDALEKKLGLSQENIKALESFSDKEKLNEHLIDFISAINLGDDGEDGVKKTS